VIESPRSGREGKGGTWANTVLEVVDISVINKTARLDTTISVIVNVIFRSPLMLVTYPTGKGTFSRCCCP
jgi:hypothetical protein